MSLDGKIATSTGDSHLSSLPDLRRVHHLRASVDGIMVGVGTLLADDPKLSVRLVKGRSPRRIIVDSRARTPLSAQVVRTASKIPTIIAVTSSAPKRKVKALERAGATILTFGSGLLVSLAPLLKRLGRMGIKRVLLEGGGILNWSMLREGLVDEVSVAISPRILGGADAVTLVEGKGVAAVRDAVKLRLLSIKRYGGDSVLRYRVLSPDA